jgi:hypothetical protein
MQQLCEGIKGEHEWPETVRPALKEFGVACEKAGIALYTFDIDVYQQAVETFLRDTHEMLCWAKHIWGQQALTPSMMQRFDACFPVLKYFATMGVTAAQMDER